METLKTIASISGMVGIPTIFATIIWFVKHCRIIAKQIEILQKAQKAQMRAQLFKDHDFYTSRGWIMQIELDEWMNQYTAYHELVGPNEVLEDRKKNLLKLPTTPN